MHSIIMCLTIPAIVLVFIAYAYDKGIKLKNYVREAFSTMDVYLKNAGI